MARCAVKHHAHKVSLRDTGDTASTKGDRTQGIGNFLQGGGAGDCTVWVGYVVPFGDNGEEGGRYTHWVPLSGHGESSGAFRRRNRGYTQGRRSAGAARTQSVMTYIGRR